MATLRPAAWAAFRIRWAFSAWSSRLPCEKFSRATSIPASTIRFRVSTSRDAGPMVATILVRRSGRLIALLTLLNRTGVQELREIERLAVDAQLAALAEVADEVPVER